MDYSIFIEAINFIILESEEFVVFADKDSGHLGFLPLDGAYHDCNILASTVMPVAVAFDPVDQQVGPNSLHSKSLT